MANMALTQLEWYSAVNRHSDLNSTQRHHRESEKEQASRNREALTQTSDHWWKANWWNKSWWERSRWTWDDEDSFFPLRTQSFAHK